MPGGEKMDVVLIEGQPAPETGWYSCGSGNGCDRIRLEEGQQFEGCESCWSPQCQLVETDQEGE